MKLDLRGWFAPLLAVVLLGVTLQQTLGALATAGAFRASAARDTPAENPYARFDAIISQPHPEPPEAVRDPLVYGNRRAPVVRRTSQTYTPVPVEEPKPVLTSIIWDYDPRATVRYGGRDFSVREDGLFADFRVMRISQTEVVLERNGERTVLFLRPKGESN